MARFPKPAGHSNHLVNLSDSITDFDFCALAVAIAADDETRAESEFYMSLAEDFLSKSRFGVPSKPWLFPGFFSINNVKSHYV